MIDADPTSAGMNSYCDVNFADAYFTFRFGAEAWLDFEDAKKEALLVHATNILDTFSYGGMKTSRTQPLMWPRQLLIDTEGYPLDSTTVPVKVRQATCEMAFWVWTEEDRMMSDTDLRQIESFKAGPLDVKALKNPALYPVNVTEMLKSIGQGVLQSVSGSNGPINATIVL